MSTRVLVRGVVASLLGVLCGVATACVVVLADDPATAPLGVERSGVPAGSAGVPLHGGPRDVLRAWDAARARAWTEGDVAALGDLYLPGSVAGRRDAAMLAAWNARGRRVTDLTTQVLRLEVLREERRRLVLRVTDRLTLVASGTDVLPLDLPSTRRIELRRTSGVWRVAAVLSD